MPQSSRQLNSSRKVPPISARIGKEPSYRISLSKSTDDRPVTGPVRKVKKPWQAVFAGSPVLILVIFFHFLFAMVAAFLIVSSFAKERRRQFSEASVVANNPHKEVEHKVQMAKKKNAMTTPEIVERITTTGLSPVTLPEVTIPNINSDSPGTGKMEGVGLGGGGGGAGEPIVVDTEQLATSVFGSSDSSSAGLEGRFYDLKQMANGTPSGMKDLAPFYSTLCDFVNQGWNDSFLRKYYVAPKHLYLSQLMIPYTRSENATKAFGVPELKPNFWVALYQGKFSVRRGGTYRLVGYADNVLEVRIDGKNVLDATWAFEMRPVRPPGETDSYWYSFEVDPSVKFRDDLIIKFGFQCGTWMHLESDKTYDIKILIGDDGGRTGFWLMTEEQGHSYPPSKTGEGPLLPLFKLSNTQSPPTGPGVPIFDKNADLGWSVDRLNLDN